MSTEFLQVDYRYLTLDPERSAPATAVTTLLESGIELMGFSQFPVGSGKSQVDLIAQDNEGLASAARAMGLTLSRQKTGFLIRGEESPGKAVADILKRLAGAHIPVTSLQAISGGAGRFGALLWVNSSDVEAAMKALGASAMDGDLVDETSRESFPASDAPSWATARGK